MGAGSPPKTFAKWQQAAAALPAEDNSYLARHLRGAVQTHRDWVAMDVMRQMLRQQWADYFAEVDILICPVAPASAIPHDHGYMYDRVIHIDGEERPYMDILSWAGLAGVAGLPATVIPAGCTADGLPVGMQIIGPWLEDFTPIQAARLFEEVLGGYAPPPLS
jgi:amidase